VRGIARFGHPAPQLTGRHAEHESVLRSQEAMPARDNGALRGYASIGQHGATADACRSVARGTEKIVRIARER